MHLNPQNCPYQVKTVCMHYGVSLTLRTKQRRCLFPFLLPLVIAFFTTAMSTLSFVFLLLNSLLQSLPHHAFLCLRSFFSVTLESICPFNRFLTSHCIYVALSSCFFLSCTLSFLPSLTFLALSSPPFPVVLSQRGRCPSFPFPPSVAIPSPIPHFHPFFLNLFLPVFYLTITSLATSILFPLLLLVSLLPFVRYF